MSNGPRVWLGGTTAVPVTVGGFLGDPQKLLKYGGWNHQRYCILERRHSEDIKFKGRNSLKLDKVVIVETQKNGVIHGLATMGKSSCLRVFSGLVYLLWGLGVLLAAPYWGLWVSWPTSNVRTFEVVNRHLGACQSLRISFWNLSFPRNGRTFRSLLFYSSQYPKKGGQPVSQRYLPSGCWYSTHPTLSALQGSRTQKPWKRSLAAQRTTQRFAGLEWLEPIHLEHVFSTFGRLIYVDISGKRTWWNYMKQHETTKTSMKQPGVNQNWFIIVFPI